MADSTSQIPTDLLQFSSCYCQKLQEARSTTSYPYLPDETLDTIEQLKYPEEFYAKAESRGVLQCQWSFSSPSHFSKQNAIVIANIAVAIIEQLVRQPLEQILTSEEKRIAISGELPDSTTAQRIQENVIDPILKKLAQKEEERDFFFRDSLPLRPSFKEEARKHVSNIMITHFANEVTCLVQATIVTNFVEENLSTVAATMALPFIDEIDRDIAINRVRTKTLNKLGQKESLEKAIGQIFMNSRGSLADALGCEVTRVYKSVADKAPPECLACKKKTSVRSYESPN